MVECFHDRSDGILTTAVPQVAVVIAKDNMGLGNVGPYLKHNGSFTSIPAGDDVLTIGLNRAVDLIANNPKKKTTAKALGESEGKSVTVQSGRYGPYVQLGKVRATLPKDETEDSITLERALELIAAKAAKGAPKKKARRKTSAN